MASNPKISIDSTYIHHNDSVPSSYRPSLDSNSGIPRSGSPISGPTSSSAAAVATAPGQTTMEINPPRAHRPSRNRSALRQFYGLASKANPSDPNYPQEDANNSELDRPDFDANKYVEELCTRGDLRELLKAENELINEIRGFDGERKALVYDNYSKLISATETIKKMRANMEPLTPTTSTLEPAMAHIAEVSSALAHTIFSASSSQPVSTKNSTRAKRDTVRWALAAPMRIENLILDGNKEMARKEWESEILPMLEKWKGNGVKGVDELRKRGERALTMDVRAIEI